MAKKKRKRKSSVGAKRKYKIVSCHTTKTAAKKKASAMRKAGKTASIVKQGKRYCIKSAGRRKRA